MTKKKYYTPVLHLFNCVQQYAIKPKSLKFVCKENGCVLHSPAGDFSNLNKHLLTHPVSKTWYDLYRSNNRHRKDIIISEETLNLTKYFISFDQALCHLKNPFLMKLVLPSLKIHSCLHFAIKFYQLS